MNEVWRPILGYPHYEASNLGLVRSLDRPRHPGRVLAIYRHKSGQLAVRMSENGKRSLPLISRLIWLAFNGPIPAHAAILHKDLNRHNNRLDNLKMVPYFWTTAPSKLTAKEVLEIRDAKDVTHQELADKYGVSDVTIHRIIHYKSWKNV
jgi:hypothetical protein